MSGPPDGVSPLTKGIVMPAGKNVNDFDISQSKPEPRGRWDYEICEEFSEK
jgi:hypothetical protein